MASLEANFFGLPVISLEMSASIRMINRMSKFFYAMLELQTEIGFQYLQLILRQSSNLIPYLAYGIKNIFYIYKKKYGNIKIGI